jgi:Flp pilus assembly protein TadG
VFAGPMRSLLRDVKGSALVEGALLIPVLFVLMYGVYDFSWFFYQQQLVSTGVRDAARYLARSPAFCDAASPDRVTQEDGAKNLAVAGAIGGGPARVPGWTANMIAVTCTSVANPIGADGLKMYRGGPFINIVTVSTRFAESSLGFFGLLRLSVPVISMSHSQRVIGPG